MLFILSKVFSTNNVLLNELVSAFNKLKTPKKLLKSLENRLLLKQLVKISRENKKKKYTVQIKL